MWRSGTACNWWMRSANSTTQFRNVNNNGNANSNNASNSNWWFRPLYWHMATKTIRDIYANKNADKGRHSVIRDINANTGRVEAIYDIHLQEIRTRLAGRG